MKNYSCKNNLSSIRWTTRDGKVVNCDTIEEEHLENLYFYLRRLKRYNLFVDSLNLNGRIHPDYWIKWCKLVAKHRGWKHHICYER